MRITAAIFVLSLCVAPARADFQYTESAQVTGGALISMMKAASIFSKNAREQQKEAMVPQITTRYVTADFMRLDRPDGTIQIIDLPGKRVIEINTLTKTYAIATFEQIKAAMAAATQQMQQAMQQAKAEQAAQTSPQAAQQNPQVTMTPEFHVTPVGPAQPILNTPVNETKVQFDMVMTAQNQTQNGQPAQNPQPGSDPNQQSSMAMGMHMDMFLAPSITGQEELAAFYRRLAKEIDWTPPAVFGVDNRMGQGLRELQDNGQSLKGFPMTTYASMTMAATGQQGAAGPNPSQDPSQSSAQNNPPPQDTSSQPNSPSAMLAQKFGLFGKKKPNSNSGSGPNSGNQQGNGSQGGSSASLLDMTMQVTSYSAAPIDKSVFGVPAGMTQVQQDPMAVLNPATPQVPAKR
jgi:uncharacterized membrane protein YgcG